MYMFLYLESLALLLEHHAKVDVKSRGIGRQGVVIRILHIASGILGVFRRHPFGHIPWIHILDPVEPALPVDLSLTLPVTVCHH